MKTLLAALAMLVAMMALAYADVPTSASER